MTRFSTDEKIQAVIRYQKGSVSLKSIAKLIELHHRTGLEGFVSRISAYL